MIMYPHEISRASLFNTHELSVYFYFSRRGSFYAISERRPFMAPESCFIAKPRGLCQVIYTDNIITYTHDTLASVHE